MLLMLIIIFLLATFGQVFDLQHNNKDYRKQRAKEVLWSNQVHFYTNPLNSETNDNPAHFKSSFLSPMTILH